MHAYLNGAHCIYITIFADKSFIVTLYDHQYFRMEGRGIDDQGYFRHKKTPNGGVWGKDEVSRIYLDN